ncbi:DUF2789 domain-containing protein [Geothrix sp. 21YS21S-4]|uniref:DUF2789 domain-containing protein n=1 Tax=Geothrix sp. 21YS21S-4 TaxID=3068889 RepID=UPI0027B98699|nr:DUF2789 domain-containing protein [Geothrix sp. 21YS21S-4]
MNGNLHSVTHHSMTDLFVQLGLPSQPAEIQAFIESNCPLDTHIPLYQAPFWSLSQAQFLREQVQDDADWAGIIDKLDTGLRRPVKPSGS